MSAFDLLSKNMQKKIWEMKWQQFTPIQEKAIPAILTTNQDVILSSATASGKTEAALLPILSIIEGGDKGELKVIYISPLKALINSQFERVTELSDSLDIQLMKWHGDVGAHAKKKFLNKPTEILQITPESLESLFINYSNEIDRLFKQVDFVIIDEIHSFIGTDRGVHLQSLLFRINEFTAKRFRTIGLSATIDNFQRVKSWVNYQHPETVTVIEEKGSSKDLLYSLLYFESSGTEELRTELLEDIRELTREQKAIIFCNSRGKVEEVTVTLNRLAKREGVGETYYTHHSSIDKKEREYVEKLMQETKVPKSIVSTSTLELGIDIGSVDLIIQLDSTFSVSSLKQRLGRSGRKQGTEQILQLYATDDDNLLQSLAIMELVLEEWVEPVSDYVLPYDIAIQQIISICAQTNGINADVLCQKVLKNQAFYMLEEDKVVMLIRHLIKLELLAVLANSREIIVGIVGEKLLRSRDFYAIFRSSEEYQVLHGTKTIGQIQKTPMVSENDTIILAGKTWTITSLKSEKNKCYVVPASKGKSASYFGNGGYFHQVIGEKIISILCDDSQFDYLDEAGSTVLSCYRKFYSDHHFSVANRRIIKEGTTYTMETFASTEIATTIFWLLKYFGVSAEKIDYLGRVKFRYEGNLPTLLSRLASFEGSENDLLQVKKNAKDFQTKYSSFLPADLLDEVHGKRVFNLEGTTIFLDKIEWKIIET